MESTSATHTPANKTGETNNNTNKWNGSLDQLLISIPPFLEERNIPSTDENVLMQAQFFTAERYGDHGNYREEANMYRNLCERKRGNYLTYASLQGFLGCFSDNLEAVPITKSDIKFLYDIEKHATTSTLNRMKAAHTASVFLLMENDRQGAVERTRKALVYESQMTDEERNGNVFDGATWRKVNDILKELTPGLRYKLAVLEGRLTPSHKKPYEEFPDTTDFSKIEAAWKAGHKKLCRVPFDFKAGDVVKLKQVDSTLLPQRDWAKLNFKTGSVVLNKGSMEERKTINGYVMEVVGTVDPFDQTRDKKTLWVVDFLGGGMMMTVRGYQMTLVIATEERGKF
ncbi:hypothetical protein HDU76_006895 [Blyttiomyces sp. JEL0837]|nr:hypothetical protein HDU76_006895 [Blyttiomyces sp. JEL0837]